MGNAYSLWCQHFIGKKVTFQHTGQDKTRKKNDKGMQMNRERGSKKKNKAPFKITVTYRMVYRCIQSKCFLLGGYILLNKLENG